MQVLDNLSITVAPSEFVALVGPSGCGKTTILKIIAGLEQPDGGQTFAGDVAVTGPSSERGIVFQNFALFPWLTVRQNIGFGLKIRGRERKVIHQIVEAYLAKVGLTGFGDFYPAELSGGMQQRVAIARTLANDPDILLLDEPFGSLDAYTRSAMQEFLLELLVDYKKTTIFVTHDIRESVYLADRVIVLSARPTTVLEEITVDLPRPRRAEDLYSEQFRRLVENIQQVSQQWESHNFPVAQG